MPYHYKRIFSASTRDELNEALPRIEENRFEPLFLGARCYQSAVGPPQAKGCGLRWFDEAQDPNQLWLPFEQYTPVRVCEVYSDYHPDYGDGWAIAYENHRGRDRTLVYHVNQIEGRNRIIALSLYLRVETRRRRRRDVANLSELTISRQRYYTNSPTLPRPPRDNSDSVRPISRALSTILAEDSIRDHLEREVSRMEEVQQPLLLNPETGAFYNEFSDTVAHVIRCTQLRAERRIIFYIALHEHPENTYSTAVHCSPQDITRLERESDGANE